MNNHQLAFIINCLIWVTGVGIVLWAGSKLVAAAMAKWGLLGVIGVCFVNYAAFMGAFIGCRWLGHKVDQRLADKDPDFADPKLWGMLQDYAHRAGVR